MIKQKVGYCIDCPDNQSQQALIAGRCQRHYWQYRNKMAAEKKKGQQKTNANGSIVRRTPIKRSPIQKNTGTQLWMEHHIAEADRNGWICENCAQIISSSTGEARYGAQAHILPKATFPSVKNVLENHLLLGRFNCSCHGQFDSSWLNASRMGVFPKAWRIVQKLIPLLNPEELRRLPEVFQKPLPNNNE